jgi:hypothetical protein
MRALMTLESGWAISYGPLRVPLASIGEGFYRRPG